MLLRVLYLLKDGHRVHQLGSETLTPEVLLQKSEVILIADVSVVVHVDCPEEDLKMGRRRFELEKG